MNIFIYFYHIIYSYEYSYSFILIFVLLFHDPSYNSECMRKVWERSVKKRTADLTDIIWLYLARRLWNSTPSSSRKRTVLPDSLSLFNLSLLLIRPTNKSNSVPNNADIDTQWEVGLLLFTRNFNMLKTSNVNFPPIACLHKILL